MGDNFGISYGYLYYFCRFGSSIKNKEVFTFFSFFLHEAPWKQFLWYTVKEKISLNWKKFCWFNKIFFNVNKSISFDQRKFFWINKTFFNSKKFFLWPYIKETVFSVCVSLEVFWSIKIKNSPFILIFYEILHHRSSIKILDKYKIIEKLCSNEKKKNFEVPQILGKSEYWLLKKKLMFFYKPNTFLKHEYRINIFQKTRILIQLLIIILNIFLTE